MSEHLTFWKLSLKEPLDEQNVNQLESSPPRLNPTRLSSLVQETRALDAYLKQLIIKFDDVTLCKVSSEDWGNLADTARAVNEFLSDELTKNIKRANELMLCEGTQKKPSEKENMNIIDLEQFDFSCP